MRCAIGVFCVSIAMSTAAPALAQEYPAKPVRLIVTTPPGSLVDTLGRLVGQSLGERLGQSFLVENRAGGTTQIGVEAVARAVPDGYTLLLGTSELASMPSMKKKLPYDPLRDFTPVALVASSWTVFAVHPKVPASTLAELVSYAKEKPGAIRYGSNGVGGALHLVVEMLTLKTGAKLTHVPYKGGAQIIADTVGGQIEMASVGIASVVGRRGQLRVLAQAGPSRHATLPDVPTTAELGMPEVVMETWFGLLGPAGLPPAVVNRLSREVAPVLQQAGVRQKLDAMGCAPAYKSPDAFASYMVEETRRWARVLPTLGIQPED